MTTIQVRRDAAVAEVRRLLGYSTPETREQVTTVGVAILATCIAEEEAEKAAYVAEALAQWEATNVPPYLDEHERAEVARHASKGGVR